MIRICEMEPLGEQLTPSQRDNPLERLAKTRYFDLDREAPHWLLVIAREGRAGNWFARRLNNWLVFKSGRPLKQVLREYWADVLMVGLAVAGGIAANVFVWVRK